MNLFELGDFTLAGGGSSKWKIECDALSEKDWRCLARMAVEYYGHPGAVEGVPRGGLPFARNLEPYLRAYGRWWIVDDVLTTGRSMERMRNGRIDVVGVVVFARGTCPAWVRPLFQMPQSPADSFGWGSASEP